MKRWTLVSVLVVALSLLSAGALAVRPAAWTHTTEAHFSTGKFDGAVSTSLGEIVLARQIKVLAGVKSTPTVVSAVAVAGNTLYAGAGNEPVVYKVQGNKAVKFAELPCTMVGCLVWTGRELLAGTGGEKAGIYRIDGRGKAKAVWADEKVKYVWAILRNADGSFYAATGPEGKVFAIDKAGKGQVVYHADKLAKNILCLIAGKDGKLYAGTDAKGLILELDPRAKTGRVLYDAPEKEIAALLLGDGGELYAATSDASKASADGAKKPATTKEGKADKPKPPTAKPAAKPPTTKPAAKPAPPKKGPAKAPPKPKEKPKDDKKPDKDKPKGDKPPDKKPDEKPKKAPDSKATKKAAPTPAAATKPKPTGKAPPATKPKAGARPAAPPTTIRVVRGPGSSRPPTRPSRPTTSGGPGNAVYVIRTDGMVETIFRKPVTILAMLRAGEPTAAGSTA
jgi:hypothetical protein